MPIHEAPPTPQRDIDWALDVESRVKARGTDWNRYLDFLSNKPMSTRTSGWDVRDGCLLTGLFVRTDRPDYVSWDPDDLSVLGDPDLLHPRTRKPRLPKTKMESTELSRRADALVKQTLCESGSSTPLDTFLTALADNLAEAIQKNPEKYAYGLDKVPTIIERYREAITSGTGIHMTGAAVIATCRQLGFRPNDKALKAFLTGQG